MSVLRIFVWLPGGSGTLSPSDWKCRRFVGTFGNLRPLRDLRDRCSHFDVCPAFLTSSFWFPPNISGLWFSPKTDSFGGSIFDDAQRCGSDSPLPLVFPPPFPSLPRAVPSGHVEHDVFFAMPTRRIPAALTPQFSRRPWAFLLHSAVRPVFRRWFPLKSHSNDPFPPFSEVPRLPGTKIP